MMKTLQISLTKGILRNFRRYFLFAFSGVIICFSSCTHPVDKAEGAEAIGANAGEKKLVKTRFSLSGMTSEDSGKDVTNILKRHKGVAEASVSFKTGCVTVKYDSSEVTLPELMKAVEEETGYLAEPFKNNERGTDGGCAL